MFKTGGVFPPMATVMACEPAAIPAGTLAGVTLRELG
jgi:hypothetical protein